eukprot:753958-Ditylum_brightwellii.AAC.1
MECYGNEGLVAEFCFQIFLAWLLSLGRVQTRWPMTQGTHHWNVPWVDDPGNTSQECSLDP